MSKPKPPWIRCPDCDEEYECTIHGGHAADCTCPAIEEWVDAGLDPYRDPATESVRKWVEENPFKDEDEEE